MLQNRSLLIDFNKDLTLELVEEVSNLDRDLMWSLETLFRFSHS